MSQATDILALTTEAAALVRSGKIVFANAAAVRLLGKDCVNHTLKSLFGPEIAGAQAGSFVAGASLGGKRCILRMTKTENDRILFLSASEPAPGLLNEPFLYSLRSNLMTVGLCADRLRELAENTKNRAALDAASSLTRSYFRLIRLTGNVSLAMDMTEQTPETPLNASQLCRQVLEAAAHFCPGLNLTWELGEDLACRADADLFRQLLLNLLSNCLMHAEGCTAVTVRLIDAGDRLILSVSDDGCGIPPEKLHTVFDRYRHGFSVSEVYAGAGLGLSAARRVAEIHGGALLLESRQGRGTTVRASFARRDIGDAAFRSPQALPDCTRDVLIGLSAGLPETCYREQYLD